MRIHPSILPSVALLLTACTGGGQYPSLAPRPIEKLANDMAVDAPEQGPLATAADPALAARIAAIVDRAEAGYRAFSLQYDARRASIAAGARAPDGSDVWMQGQQDYSVIDSARGEVFAAAADMDALRQSEVGRLNPTDQQALADAAARIDALATRQDQALATAAPR